MIKCRNSFDQAVRNELRKYDNITHVAIGQVDDYITGCWIDYASFMENYKLSDLDLRKLKAPDVDPKVI